MRGKTWRIGVLQLVLAPFLALGLVVTAPTPSGAVPLAPASVTPLPPPVVIGGSLGGGAATTGGVTTLSGLCFANPIVCAGILGGVGLGMVLWSTHDTWLPWMTSTAEAMMNFFGVGGQDCNVTGNFEFVAGKLGVTGGWSGCDWTNSPQTSYIDAYTRSQGLGPLGSAVCRITHGDGGEVTYSRPDFTAPLKIAGPLTGASGTWSNTFDLCGGVYNNFLGGELVYWKGHVFVAGQAYSKFVEIGKNPDADEYSQTTKVNCRKPDGTEQVISFSLEGHPDKLAIPSCEAAFGAGSYPLSMTGTAGYPGVETPLFNKTWDDPKDLYPGCFAPNGAFLGTCVVKVWINGQPCSTERAVCLNWETHQQDNPEDTVECKFGGYVVPIAQCKPLVGQYRPDSKPKSVQTLDPVTSEPKPGTNVQTPTWTDIKQLFCIGIICPSVPVPPDCPTTGSCDPDGKPTTQGCMSGAISWNPIKWVYTPVKCVLIWAFVPDEDAFEDGMARITNPLSNAFGPWSDKIEGAFAGVSATGCGGPLVSMPAMFQETGMASSWRPFSTCSGAMETAASMVNLALTVMIAVGGVVKGIAIIQGGLGLSTGVAISKERNNA